MEKKCNVHLLDTEPISQLALHDRLGLITARSQGWNFIRKWNYIQPKHLYFTSDEPVLSNEWYIFDNGVDVPRVGQATDKSWRGESNKFHKKIVATTNPDLHTKPEMIRRADGCPFWLQPNGLYQASDEHGLETLDTSKLTLCVPRIGGDFVEVYIEGYKEGKTITEVNVKYTFDAVKKWIGHTSRENYRPKLRSDGAVIANPVVAEKFMTRAEALAMLEDYDRELKLDTFAYKEAPTFTVENWFNNKYK